MPWLAATAFIHSLSASSKSFILRIWTLLLSILVFSLSLFGAFIVRSGIIDSVHSFANDPERGLYLLSFIGLLVMTSLLLFSYRFNNLQSNKKIVSLSKESFISINNIFFGTLIFSTMLGVLYPLIYEFIYDQKISVGAPFYNAIFVPITLIACIFLYFSIDSKWQQSFNFKSLYQPLFLSITASLIIVALAFYKFLIVNFWTLASLLIGSIIIIRYLIVIYFYFVYRKFANFFSIIAHCSLGLLIISIALNDNLSSERALNIKINETEVYKDYQINFKNLRVVPGPNFDSVKADFVITNPNGKVFTLTPEKRKYFARGQVTTETAIHASSLKDIYITIGDQLDDGSWIVNIQFNVFIRWIWFSAIMMVLAGTIAYPFFIEIKIMTVLIRFIIIVITLMFFTFFYFYINDDKYYPGADFTTSDMPDFEIKDLYSERLFNIKDLEGNYLINVWASWCITCRVEHSFLAKLDSKDIPIVGLNYKDEAEDAINWITRFGDPYRYIIHDYKGELALDLGVTGAPETFLLSDGKIIVHYRGEVNDMIWDDVFMPIIKKESLFDAN
jgi:DsbE subfamily thiol:disulfide oxidoreductase